MLWFRMGLTLLGQALPPAATGSLFEVFPFAPALAQSPLAGAGRFGVISADALFPEDIEGLESKLLLLSIDSTALATWLAP